MHAHEITTVEQQNQSNTTFFPQRTEVSYSLVKSSTDLACDTLRTHLSEAERRHDLPQHLNDVAVLYSTAETQQAANTEHWSTQPCIPSGSLNRVPATAGVKGWNVTSAGWQVTLCDPIWHVSSVIRRVLLYKF